jgi:hypothetical protein
VTAGVTGTVDLSVKGLAKADRTPTSLVPGPLRNANDASNARKEVVVPEGTSLARFAVNSADSAADFDLYVIAPDGELLSAATASASEALLLNDPAPGTYTVIANLYASPNGAATAATVEAVVLGGDEGNLSVSPDPLKLKNGKESTINLAWKDLEPGSYVGRIFLGDAASTAISLEVGGSAAAPAKAPVVIDGSQAGGRFAAALGNSMRAV